MRFSVLTWTSDVVQTVRFQVVFKRLYPKVYTTTVSTRVSNALLVGKYTPSDVTLLRIHVSFN